MPGPELQTSTCQAAARNIDYATISTAAEDNIHGEKQKIATLVFMDLESTGLPSDVGTRNVQITEMCLVAIDRNSFEVDKKLRVLNKINLCLRPRFQISPGAMIITGLYNDMLENQKEFDDSVPKLLEYFFRRLEKPICLLAHNGNRFDFPVLQAELKRLNYALGSDIVCADTLVAFRAICLSQKKAVAAENQRKNDEAQKKEEEEMYFKLVKSRENVPISEEDIDTLLSEDLESFTHISDVLMCVDENDLKPELIGNSSSEKKSDFKEFLSPTQNERTPQKNQTMPVLNGNGNVRKRKVTDPTFLPKNQYKYNKKKVIPAKRNLFPDNDQCSSPPEIDKITKFSLQHLYNHFFCENPPNSHYAEDDCISLAKVCQKINKEFLQWVDENSVAFSAVGALW